jgi:hypothetical protein
MMAWKEQTGLWKRSLGVTPSEDMRPHYERLRTSLAQFTHKVSDLAARIASSLPQLTVHDASHLEALWETADVIAGDTYPLNAMEAFVLGGAILLHDAALCFEAYEGGQQGVRDTAEWKDAYSIERQRNPTLPDSDVAARADFSALRALHAHQAATLAERAWVDPDTGHQLFLIDDSELRKRYGAVMGLIASSHYWSLEKIESGLANQINAYADFPQNWRIDPVKLACLLRCADAAHIDSRRAPDFLHAITRREGISLAHWRAQNWMARFDVDTADNSGETGLFTSNRDFDVASFDSWWVAYDAVNLAANEIRASNSLLQSRPQHRTSPQFKIRQIAGVGSPEQMSSYLRTRGWKPWSAELHVGNVEELVKRLGGKTLYGDGSDHAQIVVRELIQNARDAVAARRSLDFGYQGKITVRLRQAQNSHTVLEIEDDGVGMSERILTGPLLDFGQSFWASDLVKDEFPGLKASEFRSVGQFGIGFFSVFMISSSVRVRSRRWDRGLDSICELNFPKGLSLRPVVTFGNTDGFSGRTSTIVSCFLAQTVATNIRMKCKASGYMGGVDLNVTFGDDLAALIAGLDVLVELQLDEAEPVIVHKPINEIIENPALAQEWLSQISFTKHYENVSSDQILDASSRLRPIYSRNSLLGFAALVDQPQRPNLFRGVQTIGGLASHVNLLTDLGYFGFMEVKAESAKRDGNKLSTERDDLKSWANEQVALLRTKGINPISWCFVTDDFAKLNLDPSDILHATFRRGNVATVLTLDQILAIIETEEIAVFKSGYVDHINAYIQSSYGTYLTFVPLTNSSFLSLAVENGAPKEPHSFIGCLDGRLRKIGKRLVLSPPRNVGQQTVLGPTSVVLLSIKTDRE